MTEYTIAAIPTQYRGQMYRSRLEARWAAFFDRLGWQHEYEPFDLGKWSPDFLLKDFDILVEVKPLTKFDVAVAEKVRTAAEPGQRILITWVAPDSAVSGWRSLGAYAGEDSGYDEKSGALLWSGAFLYWYRSIQKPLLIPDIGIWHGEGKFYSVVREEYFNGLPGWGYSDHVERLWADACNAVQWEPKP